VEHLPDQLEGDGPPLRPFGQQGDLRGGEGEAVLLAEEGRDFVRREGQFVLANLQDFPARPPGDQGRQTQGVAGGEDGVEERRCPPDQAVQDAEGLQRTVQQMGIVYHEEVGSAEIFGQSVHQRVHRRSPGGLSALFLQEGQRELHRVGAAGAKGVKQVEEEGGRVGVFGIQVVPDEGVSLPGERSQGGALPVSGARVEDGEAVIQRL
jgi:hypothetical protein